MKSIVPKKVNYQITDKESDGLVCIEVLEEKYQGTVFHFGKVSTFQEDGMDGVNFSYFIDEGDVLLEEDEAFKELAASILFDLVIENKSQGLSE